MDCYLDLIPGTADSLLHLPLLADLVVQLLCQLHIVLRLVTEGSWPSELVITVS